LFFCADEGVSTWDTPTKGDPVRLAQISAPVAGAEASPNGRFLKIEQFGSLSVWDLEGGRPLQFDNTDLKRAAFSLDSKQLLVARGCDAELWDLETRHKVQTLSGAKIGQGGLTDGVYALAFSPDGRSAATANNSTVAVWNLDNGEVTNTFHQPDRQITDLHLSSDGETLVAGGTNGKLRLLNLPGGTIREEFKQPIGF
jgi:WD40 repeat protein